MSAQEQCPTYSFVNPPPVKNYLAYWWHIGAKIFSFALVVVGSLLFSVLSFPFLLLFHKRPAFRKGVHFLFHLLFRFFTLLVRVIRAASVTAEERREFKKLRSCIVVANHPSLIDVVTLISVLPNADCIVNAYLVNKNILHVIARMLFIPASDDYEKIVQQSVESLKNGSCLIIFPEGTRSKADGQNPYKKGAARISLASGCPIVPVYIGGNDKRGLRKHDSLLWYNTRHCYHYSLHKKEPVYPDEYRDLPEPAAARRITLRLQDVLSDDKNREYIENYS